jgi:AbrB family looped-hinge helix DNA binding protein
MALAHSKVTAQGRVSIPKPVRQRLAVGPGTVLEWVERGDEIVVGRATRFSSQDVHQAIFQSIFAKPPIPRALDVLKAGLSNHVRARHARG